MKNAARTSSTQMAYELTWFLIQPIDLLSVIFVINRMYTTATRILFIFRIFLKIEIIHFFKIFRFKLSRDLQRHKSIHEDFKPHGCHICGLRFYQKSSIRGHFMRHHSSDLPYKCSFCDEQFHTKILLRVNCCFDFHIF